MSSVLDTIKNECKYIDVKSPAHIMAFSFVAFCWLIAFSVATVLYLDMRVPIQDVVGIQVDGPVSPGEVAKVHFRYTRSFVPKVQVNSRTLLCSDGLTYDVQSVKNPNGDVVWPVGKNVTADSFIRIPMSVPEGICWYDTETIYQRILLPDVKMKIPPQAIKIDVQDK